MSAVAAVAVDLPLHTHKRSIRTHFHRVFALIYFFAIVALLYHHTHSLLHSETLTSSFFITLTLLVSDVILAFMNITTQAFRMNPIYREEHPERLILREHSVDLFPPLDVFVCTADPYKEPPMNVVNTALSVMAYDYPTGKVSVYVSDDGGSDLTLFAFVEAAKFAREWLPFCRENNVVDRCPEAFFERNHSNKGDQIKIMYEAMKVRVTNVIERRKVDGQYLTGEREKQMFNKWTDVGFTRREHPTIIEVLVESSKDVDVTGNAMPNLVYVSREKSSSSQHNFKSGALNVLIRVSAAMTNAPIVLTLDCDTYSNDPKTPYRALCYFLDSELRSKLAYVQFPQRFRGVNKNDIYGCEHKALYVINPEGMDGGLGPNYLGTGCFFNRRAFFGGPSRFLSPEIPQLAPDKAMDNKLIQSPEVLALAHCVAGCNYEKHTDWGLKIGMRYGSLVEDYYTGYHMQCEGWKTVLCNPSRAAFYGDALINLVDVLGQSKRWCIGLLEVAFSKYSPITFGIKAMGPLMGMSYSHNAFWPSWFIPVSVYAFLPQLALLRGITIFPKVSDPWFLLYVFLFLGSYGQHCIDFVAEGVTLSRWWNDQRMWMVRALSSFSFGSIEYILKSVGISAHGFDLTSKVQNEEQSKRYEQGTFEFGVASPMFVPLTSAAMVNLVAFAWGHVEVFKGRIGLEGMFLQMFLAGFGVVNCVPVYGAIITRSDKGKIPKKIVMVSSLFAFALYVVAYITF